MSSLKPILHVKDTVKIALMVERTDEEIERGLYPLDDGTVFRFMQWLLDNDVPQFRGGASGPGFFVGEFPVDQKARIMQWLENEGLLEGLSDD